MTDPQGRRTAEPARAVERADRWERLSAAGGRMLQELCDGTCGRYCIEVYALDLPVGVTVWECRNCWWNHWERLGRPAQRRLDPGGRAERVAEDSDA